MAMTDDDVFDDAMWDAMWEEVRAMFPKAQFSICFDKECLESELCTEDTIFLVIKHKCYCFGSRYVPHTYVMVTKKQGASCITYADAVNALVDYGYKPCAHYFLENIVRIRDTIQFETHWGS